METTEIIWMLEKPTRNGWKYMNKIIEEATVSEVVAALQASTQTLTRQLLCDILGFQAAEEMPDMQVATPTLIDALHDSDSDVRCSAADALHKIADPAAGSALLEQYHREENGSPVRHLLAEALGASQHTSAFPTLIDALSSSDSTLRYTATWGLRHLKIPEARKPLQQALALETEPYTIKVMQETLLELEGPPEQFTTEAKIRRLITQLQNAETEGRQDAAQKLADIRDERVLLPLLTLLHDEQGEIRQDAAITLAWLTESRGGKRFVSTYRELVLYPLINMLQDQESSVRAAVVQALGGWGDARVVEPLLGLIQDNDPEVRKQVVEALAFLKDERVLEPLVNAFFTDDSRDVRSYAAQGLGHWNDRRAVDALTLALQDKQSHIRRNAAEMLTWLKDERAIDALLLALQDSNPEVREWAIEAIWELCTEKADDLSSETIEKMDIPLLKALQDENSEVQQCATKILDWVK